MKLPVLALCALLSVLHPALAADTPGTSPNNPAPTVAERLASARKALAANDYGAAQRELNIAVRDDPRNADVHNLLGYSWRKRANPDVTKAFEHYYTALKLDPRHKGAHEYIGQAYLMEKRPAEAEKHLAEIEKICGGATCPEYRELAQAIADFKARQ